MQDLVRANPDLKTEFAYSLRSLATELTQAADTCGESRDEGFRIVFIGALSAYIEIDPDDKTATIVNVKLNPGGLRR